MDNNTFIGIALDNVEKGGLVTFANRGVFTISGSVFMLMSTGSVYVQSAYSKPKSDSLTLEDLNVRMLDI